MTLRRVLLLAAALPWAVLAGIVFSRMDSLVRTLVSTSYLVLPEPPAGVNGVEYPVRRSFGHVVAVVLEGADRGELESFPAVRRFGAVSRAVSYRTPQPSTDGLIAAMVTGLDLSGFVYQPLDRVLANRDVRGKLAAWPGVGQRLRASRHALFVHGHRLLQDLLQSADPAAATGGRGEFADPDPSRSLTRLGQVVKEIDPRDRAYVAASGLHLVELALPRGPRTMERGGFFDRLDDALRLLIEHKGDQTVVVLLDAGAGRGQTVESVWFGAGVAHARGIVRPLDDLVPTIAMCLGVARPAFALGSPDTGLVDRTQPADVVPVLQLALRDRMRVADQLSRAFYGKPIAPAASALVESAKLHARGDAEAAVRVLEAAAAGIGDDLEKNKRAVATDPRLARECEILCYAAAGTIVLAVLAAPSWGSLVCLSLVLAAGIGGWAWATRAPFVLDPFRIDCDRLFDLYRLAGTGIVAGLVPVSVILAIWSSGATDRLLALHGLASGVGGLQLAVLLGRTGARPGMFFPGDGSVRGVFLVAAALAVAPFLYLLFAAPLAVLDWMLAGRRALAGDRPASPGGIP